MKLTTFPLKKPWNIPKELDRAFSVKKIEKMLDAFNLVSRDMFFVADYFREKFILGMSTAPSLTGHSVGVMKKDGFEHYRQILGEEEQEWLLQMSEKTLDFLHNYPEDRRLDLLVSYDSIAENTNGQDIILHHRFTPLQLCKNGNLWLGLSHSTIATTAQISAKAIISDSKTGDTYNFIDGAYVLGKTKALTREEVNILKHLGNDFSVENICDIFGISESTLKRKKRVICEKFETNTFVAAVHKAHLSGII